MFGCGVSFLGPRTSCPTRFHEPGVRVQAVFFYSKTIQDDLIKSYPFGAPVLMRLKQSNFTIWSQSNNQVFSHYTTLSISFFCLLLLLSSPLISIFLFPKQR
jgi:hypothetical protein